MRVFWRSAAAAAAVLALLPAAWGDAPGSRFPTVQESSWVGMRFVILPQSRAVQHYGYQELYRDTDKDFAPLPYAPYAGRIARVLRIEQGHGPGGEVLDEADLQLEDTKETIHGDIDHGVMNDVAPAMDVENAKKQYVGRTLWLASDHLRAYDAKKDVSDAPSSPALQQAFKRINIKQYSPVRVLDVVPGWYASAPVRFLVQAEAARETGYVDVHMSDTNVLLGLQAEARFGDVFLETDPRNVYAWPAKVWAAIEARQVFAGMTAQQVRFSWGAPKSVRVVDPAQEQWTYAPDYRLALKNGILAVITKS